MGKSEFGITPRPGAGASFNNPPNPSKEGNVGAFLPVFCKAPLYTENALPVALLRGETVVHGSRHHRYVWSLRELMTCRVAAAETGEHQKSDA